MGELTEMNSEEYNRFLYTRIKTLELTDIATDENFEVYLLLSDVIAILKGCYRELGLGRPLYQTHADALGITLSALEGSCDCPEETIRDEITENCARLRDLPPDFRNTVSEITDSRKKARDAMDSQQYLEEAFAAYLASRSMNEEDWIRENHQRIVSWEE